MPEPTTEPTEPTAPDPEANGTPAAPAPEATAAGEPNPWGGLQGELLGMVQNKGWKSPEDALKSYQSLERLRGVPEDQLIRTPGADASDEEWSEVYAKLGRPEKPEGYGLEAGEGQPDLGALAHAAGLTKRQVEVLQKGLAEIGEGQTQASEQKRSESIAKEFEGVRQEWGKDFDARVAQGQHAVRALGWDGETIEQLENAMGPKWVMDLTSRIGKGLGDHGGLPGEGAPAGGFVMTREMAMAKYNELNADPKFLERLHNENKNVRMAAQAERDRLNEIIDAE